MAKVAFYNFIVGILIIIIGWFGVWGLFKKSSEAQSSIDKTKELINQERLAIESIAEIKNLIDSRQEEIAKLKIAIPPERDVSAVIAAMEEAANLNGLALTSLDITDPEESQAIRRPTRETRTIPSLPYKVLEVRAEMSGRYGALQSFLDDLESSLPVIETSSLSFQPPLEGAALSSSLLDPIFDFVVSVETYYIEE